MRADDTTATAVPSAPATTVSETASPEMTEYLQNRAVLAEKLAQLNSQSANGAPTVEALNQFQQQNAALLSRQAQLAQTLAQQQDSQPNPTPPPLKMPADASPQLQEYLTARDQLMRDEIALRNKHLNDSSANRDAAIQLWHDQNATRIGQVQQLGQNVSNQAASISLPTPPPLQLPPDASPQLKAFLRARYLLMRDEIAFRNQHLNDDPSTRDAAIQQWQQQNAARLQQIQQMAQTLSNSN